MNGTSKKNVIVTSFYFIIFCTLFVFWTKISPYMVADADDWSYISFSRQAVPIWHGWNPVKIMPETLMGLCGYFAAYIVFPICQDYIMAMTYVFAFVTTLIVITYLYSFDRLIRTAFKIEQCKALFITYLFLVVHFLLLKTGIKNNQYLLMGERLVCVTNYLWPMFFAAILTMVVLRIYIENKNYKLKLEGGWLLLAIYLTVFSNIVTNIIYISFVSGILLYNFITEIKLKQFCLQKFISSHATHLMTILLDLIGLYFEYHGGRSSISEMNLQQTIEDLKRLKDLINYRCIILMAIMIVIAIIILIKRNKTDHVMDVNYNFKSLIAIAVYSGIITTLYLIILLIRVGDHKFLYTDNLIVLFFYFNFLFAISAAYVFKQFAKITIIIPICTYLLFFSVINVGTYQGNDFRYGGQLYKSIINGYSTAMDCHEDGLKIVEQFIEADAQNVEEFELFVSSNALASFSGTGDRISMTLYRHGIIRKPIKAIVRLRE